MFLNPTSALWHYLGSFLLYTLVAIGVIYAAYWYTRRQSTHWLNPLGEKKKSPLAALKLEMESSLALEPRKTLYVVRSGQERFLVSASAEKTDLLAKLEPLPPVVSAKSIKTDAKIALAAPKQVSLPEKPWYTEPPRKVRVASQLGVGARLMQSVRWLVASRMKQS